uniref:Endonuclease/exonuclease/phosphatase domain-containing protein n=1 Tax=Aegilops tauschii subsp. strangulata TaxID=200361 RepID=A0A453JPI0_AEGTS
MSHLFWNCRGAGNRRTVREVGALVKAHSPSLVFLSETRQTSVKVERMKWKLGLKGFCGVDCEGRGGGLALFWDESLQVIVLDSCKRYIDISVLDQGSGKTWRSTFVYGEPRVEHRQRM